MRVIQNALSVRRSCPRPWEDGSKVGNPAQPDFIIIIGREIWDGRTLAGRYTAIRPPSPNPEPGLGRESSGPDWGLKGFSDEEATKCSRSWACPNRHLCCSLQQGAGACKTAKRMGWDSSGEDSPSARIHGVCAATPLAAWFYMCLEACVENQSETVFGGHS